MPINKTNTKLVQKKKDLVSKLGPSAKIDEIQKLVDKVDPKKFSLITEVKKNPLYKLSNRDKRARAVLEQDKKNAKLTSKNNIVPGQLVLFKYLNPKNADELEYYDASPCTIFFGIFNSSNGKRVLGFNIHYFPPQLRYNIMQQIYEMYKPVYRKYFETGVSRDLDAFDYSYLTDELSRHHLAFASPLKYAIMVLRVSFLNQPSVNIATGHIFGGTIYVSPINSGIYSRTAKARWCLLNSSVR